MQLTHCALGLSSQPVDLCSGSVQSPSAFYLTVWGALDLCSCISASLPKTEANWHDVISDLQRFEDLIQSIHIDANLYTENNAHPNCKVTAMKCFLLELHVIWQESNNMDIRDTIENLIILANSSLSSNGNITESGCKECEELEEKNVKEFLRSFVQIVQMFINTS
ncbi:interleukin-15 isoform X1 [Molossus molossus]|uniref:interleukin-15 isoform X1 n=1 Tax=Molossus molossus TaxID=27622 RepID=UPI001745F4D5|nr:interleukin-15 isoform X1 [Molossus molossus]